MKNPVVILKDGKHFVMSVETWASMDSEKKEAELFPKYLEEGKILEHDVNDMVAVVKLAAQAFTCHEIEISPITVIFSSGQYSGYNDLDTNDIIEVFSQLEKEGFIEKLSEESGPLFSTYKLKGGK